MHINYIDWNLCLRIPLKGQVNDVLSFRPEQHQAKQEPYLFQSETAVSQKEKYHISVTYYIW